MTHSIQRLSSTSVKTGEKTEMQLLQRFTSRPRPTKEVQKKHNEIKSLFKRNLY